jgi:hypothetical protein
MDMPVGESGTNRAHGAAMRPGRRPQILLAAHWILWALCFAGAFILIKRDVVRGPIAWLVAAVPSFAAAWLLAAYARYLRHADELERLIEMHAVGWGFGGGFFLICSYRLFEPLGAPPVDPDAFMTVVPLLYVIAKYVVWRRYR